MSLGDRIKEARLRVGMTQSALAKKCGIAPPSLHGLENGRSKSMRQTTLLRMARALSTSPEWLAFGSGEDATVAGLATSSAEQDFLMDFRKLSVQERKIVIRMVRFLVIDK